MAWYYKSKAVKKIFCEDQQATLMLQIVYEY